MYPPLTQNLRLWDVLQLLYIYRWIVTSPVTSLKFWPSFNFLSGGTFSEVHNSVPPPQPHSDVYTQLPPYSYTAYGTWQFCCSCLPLTYCFPEWCHWLSLYVLRGNLGGLPSKGKQPRRWLIMKWGQQGLGTHQIPSILEKVCRPLIKYPMSVWMYIKLPCSMVLWTHLPPSVTFSCLYITLIFLPVCVYHHASLHNFGRWIAWTSVPACYLALVHYCPLQFHCDIHSASVLHIILCLWYCNW